MKKMTAIGLDIGTSTICAVVMDANTGELLHTITRQNDSLIDTGHAWERVQNPSFIISLVEQMLLELETTYAPVTCIGFSGQMHGIVYLDSLGEAVSPLYTWQDGRGNLEYQPGITYADDLSRASGYQLATGYGAVTHFYNLVNGLVPPSAKRFCTIHDYAAMRLANVPLPLIHPTNAASIGFYRHQVNNFDHAAITAAGIDAAYFPNVTPEFKLVGKTASGIPVAVAIGDNQASFIGAVRSSADSLLVNIGTSGQISLAVDHAIQVPPIDCRPLTHDGFLLVGSSLCGGRSYALLENFFRSVVQMATGMPPPALYDIMNAQANDFQWMTGKLEIATQFSGTRDHPLQRAAIKNLSVDNFTPQHFIVGVLEGVARELFDLYAIMGPELSQKPKMLVGSGNAMRLCKPLQRVVSDMFAMPIHIPVYKEETACGAALFALVAAGHFSSIAEAQSLVRYE